MRVLLVEPDRKLSNLIDRALSSKGYEVTIAADSQTAVDKMDNFMVDVIVLELAMPEHNGLEFLHEIRSHSEWINVPAIIHSRLNDKEINFNDSHKKSLNVLDYLYKPKFSLKELTGIIEGIPAVEKAK